MSAIVERLGLTPVRALRWLTVDDAHVGERGLDGDRRWTPVRHDLTIPRATDRPDLVAVHVDPDELPTGEGVEGDVRYYGRVVPSTLHRGDAAEKISACLGEDVRLARSRRDERFVWAEPVSVVLRSELLSLPGDLDRYRANVVVDDLFGWIEPEAGMQLALGDVVLEVVAPLTRCVVIEHDPVKGGRDASLLRRLPGVRLGWGCRVLRPGRLVTGESVRVLPR